MVDSSERDEEQNSRFSVGGPDILSMRDISVMAAGAAGVLRPRCEKHQCPQEGSI